MKNLLNVLHGVWAVTTAVLFYLVLSRPAGSGEPQVIPAANPTQALPTIYYVDFDSLNEKSTYVKQWTQEAEARQNNIRRDLERRAQQFQLEVQDYQQKAATMTPMQREVIEQGLNKKQQDLMQYREQMSERVSKEQSDKAEAIYKKIQDFLRQQDGLGNVAYVLAYQRGSSILVANDSLNITQRVVEGLNAQHTAEKSQKKK